MANYQGSGADLTIQEFVKMINTIIPTISESHIKQKYALLSTKEVLSRAHVAVLLDQLLNPFDLAIDWFGKLK